jgi:hypothetical protein
LVQGDFVHTALLRTIYAPPRPKQCINDSGRPMDILAKLQK